MPPLAGRLPLSLAAAAACRRRRRLSPLQVLAAAAAALLTLVLRTPALIQLRSRYCHDG